MLIDQLNESSLFNQLDTSSLVDIAAFCETIELDDGDVLLRENDPENNDIYLLITGSLEIISNRDENISNEIAISVHEKDIFGEIAWLTGQKRTASVRSHGPSHVIRIDGPKLHNFIDENPKTGCIILKSVGLILSDRVKASNTLIKQILWNNQI